jgi:hypothetical protein
VSAYRRAQLRGRRKLVRTPSSARNIWHETF